MNSSLYDTALRPVFAIGRMSTRARSKSVKNSVIPWVFFALSEELRGARQQRDPLRLLRLGGPHLRPLTTWWSPSRLANGVILVVSRPATGSVTPQHTCRLPSTIRGNVRAFSSSEP